MTYDPSVTDTVASYVRAVESHLAGVSADEREEILRNVESHIYDALAARAGEGATIQDIYAVLAEMDPPESYADGRPTPPAPVPSQGPPPIQGRRSLGGWALAVMIGGIVLPLLILAAGAIFAKTSDEEAVIALAVMLAAVMQLVALALAIASWRERAAKVVVIVQGFMLLLMLAAAVRWWADSDEAPQPPIPFGIGEAEQIDHDPILQQRVAEDFVDRGFKRHTVDIVARFALEGGEEKTYRVLGGIEALVPPDIAKRAADAQATGNGDLRFPITDILFTETDAFVEAMLILHQLKVNGWLEPTKPAELPAGPGVIHPDLQHLLKQAASRPSE